MFKKSDMVYSDYSWKASSNLDDPKVISGNDYNELNRSEGYEMIYFIRSLAKSWEWKDDAIRACQKLEKTIRTRVPSNIQRHGDIKSWIEANFKDFWDTL